MPDIVRTVLTFSSAALFAWQIISRVIRKNRSTRWPTAIATIETFEVQPVGGRFSRKVQCFCELGYSYSINGSYQAGRFALGVAGAEAAEDLGKAFKGRTLEIRYNPNKLDNSLPAQSELDGRKIVILEDEDRVQVEF